MAIERTELNIKRFNLESEELGIQSSAHPLTKRYLVVILCVAVAFGIRYSLAPILGEELPFLMFIAAALIAAWYGGVVTGLVALMLGLILANHFFVPAAGASNSPDSVEIFRLIRYVFTAALGVVLIEVLHRGRRRVEAAAAELEQEVVRRKASEECLREAQRRLSEHAQDLERRVTERTRELAGTVKSLEDLLYQMVHTLRAPLRAMKAFSQLLITEEAHRLDCTGQDYARRISDASERMDVLMRDLLKYGRVIHINLNSGNVSLERVAEQALAQLDHQLKSREAEVQIVRPMPEVYADDGLLVAVLVSLLDNAIKFVRAGVEPRVKVWADRCDSVVRLWIEDNGIGIAEQYFERIFGTFERLHPDSIHEGTGIGLAIVKHGVERMGGQVGVVSQPGAGSRFWLELPAGQPGRISN